MQKTLLFIAMIFIVAACGHREHAEERAIEDADVRPLSQEQKAFLENLRDLCGKSFAGEQVFMAEGRESWEDLDFTMHITKCEEDEVHVPFHLNGDESRTWLFLVEDEGLRFRHDHRYPDGTPEEQTLYGGYSDGLGDQFEQNFPADDYTCELIPTSCHAIWTVKFSEDLTTFSYMLSSEGELIFRADFDLTEPLDKEI